MIVRCLGPPRYVKQRLGLVVKQICFFACFIERCSVKTLLLSLSVFWFVKFDITFKISDLNCPQENTNSFGVLLVSFVMLASMC